MTSVCAVLALVTRCVTPATVTGVIVDTVAPESEDGAVSTKVALVLLAVEERNRSNVVTPDVMRNICPAVASKSNSVDVPVRVFEPLVATTVPVNALTTNSVCPT